MIEITPTLSIDENQIQFEFIRGSGPGGQNVNKVATAAQMRVNVHNLNLPQAVLERLKPLAGHRLTEEGILIITARRFRTQEKNRQDALDRLVDLLQQAATPPKPRRKTKPSRATKERRLAQKNRRGAVKRLRGRVDQSQE
ncbi:MAG: alternative ribosome rescue aminoacyl-tRNA hydrolase ArfB [Chloroflexota bacterium]